MSLGCDLHSPIFLSLPALLGPVEIRKRMRKIRNILQVWTIFLDDHSERERDRERRSEKGERKEKERMKEKASE